jgi:hypothetical protein
MITLESDLARYPVNYNLSPCSFLYFSKIAMGAETSTSVKKCMVFFFPVMEADALTIFLKKLNLFIR